MLNKDYTAKPLKLEEVIITTACQKSPQYLRHSEPVPQHWCGNPPDERRNNWFRNQNV